MTGSLALAIPSLFFVFCGACAVEENLKKLVLANNEYAIQLYKKTTNGSSENVFFSPLSLSTAMAMVYYGAKGETVQELRQVLGYDKAELDEQHVHSTFHQLLAETLRSEQPERAYTLNCASAVLLDKHLELTLDYKNQMQELYDALVKVFDFSLEEPRIVQEVNDFVRIKTNGKINQVIDQLSSSAYIIILNVVYFKGTWKTQFESKKTYPQNFYNGGLKEEAKKVSMMHLIARFPYADLDDCQALELPYKGETMSMLVLLPDQIDGLTRLESSLTWGKVTTILHELGRKKVIVALPKFRLQYSREMSEVIKNLGASRMFNPDADFSGMANNSNIFVNQILHKAIIEVNEKGSEASAVTGIMTRNARPSPRPRTPSFIADHPFLFVIIDNRNGMILFFGRVNAL